MIMLTIMIGKDVYNVLCITGVGNVRPAKAFRPDRGGKARQKKKQRKKPINICVYVAICVYIFII